MANLLAAKAGRQVSNKPGDFSGNAENVDWSDIAMTGRAYADNLINEPTISQIMHKLADEIERRRLTDAEREFLQNLRDAYEELTRQTGYVNAASQKEARTFADLIGGLLERTK